MDNLMLLDGPLKSHYKTKYTEYFAYLVIKLCYPEKYDDLLRDDAPDLQKPDKSIGIEVTVAVSRQTAQIDGVSAIHVLSSRIIFLLAAITLM